MIEYYLQTPNGSDVVGMALGSTAAAFVGLSVVALTTRKDFSFMTGFLTVGMIALLGVVILSWVFDLSAFYGAIGGAVVLLMSGLILWQTSAIIHGGETNYGVDQRQRHGSPGCSIDRAGRSRNCPRRWAVSSQV